MKNVIVAFKAIVVIGLVVLGIVWLVSTILHGSSSQATWQPDLVAPQFRKELNR